MPDTTESSNVLDLVGLVGWGAGSVDPEYDPGLDALCPCCFRPVRISKRRPVLVTLVERPGKTYFVRVHRHCWKELSAEEQASITADITNAVRKACNVA